MSDNDNKNNAVDSPSNRSLSTLIDQDLQKESELLQNLIEEVVEANKKVKASHQKRLEDSEEKMRIMNQEIKRLRTAINRKDEETTKAQFDHLLSSKDKIHESLRSMRLKPLEDLINETHDKTAEGLKERLIETVESVTEGNEEPLAFMRRFKESATEFIEKAYRTGTESTYDSAHADAFEKAVQAFKEASASFTRALGENLETITAKFNHRNHVLSDGSIDKSLKERMDATYKEKKTALEEELEQLENDKSNALSEVDDTINDARESIEQKIRETFKDALEKEKQDQETLDEDLKKLKLDIIRAEKHGEEDTLKDLLKTYEKKTSQSENLVEHKVQSKIEKAFSPKRKKLMRKKRDLEKEYAKKRFDIEQRRAELDVRYSGSDELFKVQGDLDALRRDRDFDLELTNALKALSNTFESLFESICEFTEKMRKFMVESRISYLKEAASMTRSLGDVEVAFKEAQMDLALSYRQKALDEERTGIEIKSALRRQAITMHYHRQILNAEKDLNDTIRQADIDKTYQQESAQNEKIYQQGLIELADKEYELQLLKVRSLYDNEIALTRAQAERLNVGHDVNEAMVSTTLESQMHFARQQIKYAENEYEVRLENIESALRKELEYAEEKLSTAKQKYRSDIHELKSERDRKLKDLAYRQALFTDPKEKRKLDEQEAKIKEHYDKKIAKIEEAEQADDTVQRYQKQIDNANARAEKAKEDAKYLREKSISTFRTMLDQSEQKLNQYKSESNSEGKLGPYIESEASKTAEKRLNEAMDEANKLYKEKVRKPQKRIEKLNETINSIEFDERTQSLIDEKRHDMQTLKDERDTALEKESAQTEATLKALDEKETALNEKASALKEKLSGKDRTDTAQRFEKYIEQLKASMDKDTEKMESSFKARFQTMKKSHHQSMDNLKNTLDDSLNPTIKAYESFTKKASSTQRKALKKAKRQVDERLKSTLKEIDNAYDTEL